MVRGDRANHLSPGHAATGPFVDAAADRLQHDIAGVEHIALVAVIEGEGAKGPLDDHLAKPDRAGLQGNVGDPVHGHARGDLQPEAGITGDGQEALAHRAHVGGELGLERVEKNVGAQFDRFDRTGLAHQPRFAVGGDDAAGGRWMELIQGGATAAESQVGASDLDR